MNKEEYAYLIPLEEKAFLSRGERRLLWNTYLVPDKVGSPDALRLSGRDASGATSACIPPAGGVTICPRFRRLRTTATAVMTAPAINEMGGPHRAASPPVNRLPMGVVPAKTTT